MLIGVQGAGLVYQYHLPPNSSVYGLGVFVLRRFVLREMLGTYFQGEGAHDIIVIGEFLSVNKLSNISRGKTA